MALHRVSSQALAWLTGGEVSRLASVSAAVGDLDSAPGLGLGLEWESELDSDLDSGLDWGGRRR